MIVEIKKYENSNKIIANTKDKIILELSEIDVQNIWRTWEIKCFEDDLKYYLDNCNDTYSFEEFHFTQNEIEDMYDKYEDIKQESCDWVIIMGDALKWKLQNRPSILNPDN